MRLMVELTAVNTDIEAGWLRELARQQQSGSRTVEMPDEELDDMEQPIEPDEEEDDLDEMAETATATAGEAGLPPAGMTYPVAIPVSAVREFYPRRHNKPGTRIVFNNGAARVVQEPYAEVKVVFEAAFATVQVR